MANKPPSFKGKKHTKEAKFKISMTRKRLMGEGKIPLSSSCFKKGHKHPEERKKYWSTIRKGRPGLKGKDNPMFGKEPWNKGRISELRGDNHPRWKGDLAGYSAIHRWVYKHKPKKEKCEHCNTQNKLQAANISKEYKRDINDFIWLCSSCHSIYDNISAKVWFKRREKIKEMISGNLEVFDVGTND